MKGVHGTYEANHKFGTHLAPLHLALLVVGRRGSGRRGDFSKLPKLSVRAAEVSVSKKKNKKNTWQYAYSDPERLLDRTPYKGGGRQSIRLPVVNFRLIISLY